MFTVNKKVEANFKKVLADFGGPGAVQRFNPATGQFYDSGIPASFQYFGSDYSNLFRRALPGTLGKLLYSTKLSPGQGPGGKDLWTWAAATSTGVGFVDPDHVAAAHNRFQVLITTAEAFEEHKKIMENADYWEEQLRLYCKIKPASWGGVGVPPSLVVLVNEELFPIYVEQRFGSDDNCDAHTNPVFKTVEPTTAETVDTAGNVVCVRARLKNSDPWGEWYTYHPNAGETVLVSALTLAPVLASASE
jgi:hypothetical protein